MMRKPSSEKMTSADALKIVSLITTIAAIPVGIWAYKSAEDWLGAIARFVAVELIVFFVVLFVIAFFMGLAQASDDSDAK